MAISSLLVMTMAMFMMLPPIVTCQNGMTRQMLWTMMMAVMMMVPKTFAIPTRYGDAFVDDDDNVGDDGGTSELVIQTRSDNIVVVAEDDAGVCGGTLGSGIPTRCGNMFGVGIYDCDTDKGGDILDIADPICTTIDQQLVMVVMITVMRDQILSYQRVGAIYLLLLMTRMVMAHDDGATFGLVIPKRYDNVGVVDGGVGDDGDDATFDSVTPTLYGNVLVVGDESDDDGDATLDHDIQKSV